MSFFVYIGPSLDGRIDEDDKIGLSSEDEASSESEEGDDDHQQQAEPKVNSVKGILFYML